MIYRVDEGFVEGEINLFTGMSYDDSWIIYCLNDSPDYQIMSGGWKKTVYSLKVSKQYPEWRMSVFDFLDFQEASNKNIILSISDSDYEEAKAHYGDHHYNDRFLRGYEPEVLIHSTTRDNWQRIQRDDCLKSWNVIKGENPDWEHAPIGKALGDPADFSDFIMFSGGEISSEIVVLSKQQGKITMDQDMPYQTGARLYFDIRKIAEDGLLIRDGAHLKVRDRLPLSPYLLWVGQWNTVGLENEFSTPREFTERSNVTFNERFHAHVETH